MRAPAPLRGAHHFDEPREFQRCLQVLPKCGAVQVSGDLAALNKRNDSRLFAYHDGNSIGVLGDADGRAAPRSEFFRQTRIKRKWEKTAGRLYSVVVYDGRAIVQRRV